MACLIDGKAVSQGKLAENVLHFARLLRAAGIANGTPTVLDALAALAFSGLRRRQDVYWTLRTVFTTGPDQQPVFDEAFKVFWRDTNFLAHAMTAMLPTTQLAPEMVHGEEMSRRLAEALAGDRPHETGRPSEQQITYDAALTWSDREVLRNQDFETMSAEEERQAIALVATLRMVIEPAVQRRMQPVKTSNHVDLRTTMRHMLRQGPDIMRLRYRDHSRLHPPVTLICDISGSMSRYARIFLHFMHAMMRGAAETHCFVFGSRLTNITRALQRRDVDDALDVAGKMVTDWSGGTRIGSCLGEFNRHWSRRVLGRGSIVLLMTDGLDRDAAAGLDQQMSRLQRSSKRLIWLNPLLRYDSYTPKSQGAQAILPHVDEIRTVHHLNSLADLAAALRAPRAKRGNQVELMRQRLRLDQDGESHGHGSKH